MLKVIGVRKEFSTVVAVDRVSLEANRGKILGLLGPNGAGKTTTIRMILNVIRPDSGELLFDGLPFSEEIRDRIGYLPEERGLYRKNKVLNTILYFASLKGIESAEARKRAYKWLERLNLLTAYNLKVEELSKGNQQKIQFITSVLHDPELVILDEPFSGLDPVNQIVMKDIMIEMKNAGKVVIFSTHQMDQAEKLCDEICLINKGKVVLGGELAQVKKSYGNNSIRIEFDGNPSFLSEHPAFGSVHLYENYAELAIRGAQSPSALLREISQRLEIRKFETSEPSLNAIFLKMVAPEGGAGG